MVDDDDVQMYIHSTQWGAQTFNTTVGYDIKMVGVKLYQSTDILFNGTNDFSGCSGSTFSGGNSIVNDNLIISG